MPGHAPLPVSPDGAPSGAPLTVRAEPRRAPADLVMREVFAAARAGLALLAMPGEPVTWQCLAGAELLDRHFENIAHRVVQAFKLRLDKFRGFHIRPDARAKDNLV